MPLNVVLDHDRAALLHGDSKDLALAEHSVDAIVTDPPAGVAFMGKDWDKDKGGRDGWVQWLAEVLAPSFKALKPGGHGLVWALPRTSHWTALALELAGFEIRDRVSHFFGTGFPKSLDVAQAVEKYLTTGKARRPDRDLGRGRIEGAGPGSAGNFDSGGHIPLTTEESRKWEGWGTALKPAVEDWWLVRKPLEGTVAVNVLTHGTGGLNIDACRINYASEFDRAQAIVPQPDFTQVSGLSTHLDANARNGQMFDPGVGRWPAHLTLDEETAAMLDAQSGELKSSHRIADRDWQPSKGAERGKSFKDTPPSSGGASRFFYVAKGSRSEKDAGLEHLPKRTGGQATDREDGSAGLANPRAGAGRTGGARNFHPTVKSIALMRWLCRLITPPGGVVLDPFAGSGSTGVAALAEGFQFIGCEMTDEYIPILVGRIRHALGMPPG